MFGLEQEYFLYREGRPLGWPKDGEPQPQGPYYCSNGGTAHGRKYVMEHYTKCLQMGLKISGINAEVAPGQWEFQIGPCIGVEAGDHMTAARWVFLRICEEHHIDIEYEPKPIKGDWNGSGCHTNFSTKEMREDGGMAKIQEAIDRLSQCLPAVIPYYGEKNNERLSGHHETSRYDQFTYGVGTRHTSIRIPNQVKQLNKGYFEDRRPASDIDPYLVTARLFSSALGVAIPALDALHSELLRPWMPK
jgi:glutamine synthetase